MIGSAMKQTRKKKMLEHTAILVPSSRPTLAFSLSLSSLVSPNTPLFESCLPSVDLVEKSKTLLLLYCRPLTSFSRRREEEYQLRQRGYERRNTCTAAPS